MSRAFGFFSHHLNGGSLCKGFIILAYFILSSCQNAENRKARFATFDKFCSQFHFVPGKSQQGAISLDRQIKNKAVDPYRDVKIRLLQQSGSRNYGSGHDEIYYRLDTFMLYGANFSSVIINVPVMVEAASGVVLYGPNKHEFACKGHITDFLRK
jgi:hypothetical protein